MTSPPGPLSVHGEGERVGLLEAFAVLPPPAEGCRLEMGNPHQLFGVGGDNEESEEEGIV